MAPETRAAIGPIMDEVYRSYGGHIVIRVAPGGSTYEVFTLNDQDDTRKILGRSGPYSSR